jgi:hypothetical protein
MFTPDQTTYDYMSLVLTHECNKKCPFCVDAYRGSGEVISLENVRNALRFAGENEIKDILIIGGEPTLHPAVEIIAGMVKDAGFRSILTTNYTKPATVKALDGLVDERNLIMQSRCPDLHKITDTDTHTSLIFEQLAGTTYLVLPMLGSPLIHSMRRASVPIEELSEAAATRLRQQLLHAMYGEPNVG